MLPYAMLDRCGFGLASWEGATLEGGRGAEDPHPGC